MTKLDSGVSDDSVEAVSDRLTLNIEKRKGLDEQIKDIRGQQRVLVREEGELRTTLRVLIQMEALKASTNKETR